MSYNVLIVDDSAIVRSVVKKTLKIAEMDLGEVLEAENGKIALELLADNWVDVVFADINMPEMNGIEMVEEMVRLDILKSAPVIIISTERSETRMEQLKSMGVSAYLNKPFAPEDVKAVVEEILGE